MATMQRRVDVTDFGVTAGGEKASLFTLVNTSGCSAKVTTYGGTLVELNVPDRRGDLANVVLGFDSLKNYETALGYFGATIGRYANRICGAAFSIEGNSYKLAVNDQGINTLHGGLRGFDKRIWQAKIETERDGAAVTLHYSSPHMEEGFPGNLEVSTTYCLKDDNSLEIEFCASTDEATPVNLTNHSYFNLDSAGEGTVLDHELMIDADRYTVVDEKLRPTGESRSVTGTAFDFNRAVRIGDRVPGVLNGYDHNFCLREPSRQHASVVLRGLRSGRVLTMYTDQPGVQVYTSIFMIPEETCGAFNRSYGVTLETQYYPDAVNRTDFQDAILLPGRTYKHYVRYAFSH